MTKNGARVANLCHRGIAKTTVMGEYLFLFIGTYGEIPGFGNVALAIYVSDSIDNVALIERQIIPLMIRMLDSLEEFIQLDTPFLAQERSDRMDRLRGMMERSDVTAAEKFRQVLEAYTIETDYGRTIEAYKGSPAIWYFIRGEPLINLYF